MREQTTQATPFEPLRNYAKAAEFLGISESTLRKWVAAKRVPHTKLGRHVRFSEAHLRQIIEAGEQAVTDTQALIRRATA